MKRCFKCGQTLPIEEFYRHPKMTDGRLGKCKSCTKTDVAANRVARRKYYLAYDHERSKRPDRARKLREFSEREIVEHPERKRARQAVWNALQSGTLARGACEVCGETRVEGHHDDYGKPLSVRWLCHRHHRMADRGLI